MTCFNPMFTRCYAVLRPSYLQIKKNEICQLCNKLPKTFEIGFIVYFSEILVAPFKGSIYQVQNNRTDLFNSTLSFYNSTLTHSPSDFRKLPSSFVFFVRITDNQNIFYYDVGITLFPAIVYKYWYISMILWYFFIRFTDVLQIKY